MKRIELELSQPQLINFQQNDSRGNLLSPDRLTQVGVKSTSSSKYFESNSKFAKKKGGKIYIEIINVALEIQKYQFFRKNIERTVSATSKISDSDQPRRQNDEHCQTRHIFMSHMTHGLMTEVLPLGSQITGEICDSDAFRRSNQFENRRYNLNFHKNV